MYNSKRSNAIDIQRALLSRIGIRISQTEMQISKKYLFYMIALRPSLQFLINFLKTSCTSNYQTRAANKSNLKESSYRKESFKYVKYSFFSLVLWNRTT